MVTDILRFTLLNMSSISLDTGISHLDQQSIIRLSEAIPIPFYSCLLGFLLPKIFKLFDFPIVFFVSLRLTLSHKRAVHTKLDIYV